MNTGFLIVSAMSILFAIIALGLGAYTASVFSTSSNKTTTTIGQSFGVWWGAFPVILTGAVGIATSLSGTVKENPGYILAVFTAVMAFISFFIALACVIYVGVITLFLFVASSLTNNVDVNNLFRAFAAGEAFMVFADVMMLVMFIYACILTCVKCCPDCCGEGCSGCEQCDEEQGGYDTTPASASCTSCDCDCDKKDTTKGYNESIVIGDPTYRAPAPVVQPVPVPSFSIQQPFDSKKPVQPVQPVQPYGAPMQGTLQPASIQMPTISATKPVIGGSTVGLPPGWIAHVDPATNNTYYENTVTNTVTWDAPKGAMPEIRA